jgi:hypothetical protein
MGDECWSGYKKVLDTEQYKYTGVKTKGALYKSIVKSFFKRVVKIFTN